MTAPLAAIVADPSLLDPVDVDLLGDALTSALAGHRLRRLACDDARRFIGAVVDLGEVDRLTDAVVRAGWQVELGVDVMLAPAVLAVLPAWVRARVGADVATLRGRPPCPTRRRHQWESIEAGPFRPERWAGR